MRALTPPVAGTRQRGLSLVELMVGITVGLFIVAAASMMATNQLNDNRRLMLETNVQQELRSAMDVIAQDVRRAGYWAGAPSGVWSPDNPSVATNPNDAIDSSEGATTLEFDYRIDSSRTAAGFRLHEHAVQMLIGDRWQSVTDPQTVLIDTLTMQVDEHEVPLSAYCLNACAAGSCPALKVRTVAVNLAGQAAHDGNVRRELNSTIRLPNDKVTGSCP
ncbi:prepilin-type N-terminal cleavage/methylation domain-containing protein [Aquincola sp. MAHUQ-54]|uniref:Prepilin-type N-terminal cleavage/methylation domain-containing protein n=1 Tax=Aquincola agrisoli TaxID=3119538 RepID=A0AAW9QDF6_9BURK